MNGITAIGIIGRGEFARLIERHCPKGVEVRIFGRESNLAQLSGCDVVFLAVPIQSYTDLLPKVSEHIDSDALVVDVCSVKVASEELIKALLSNHHNVLISHPMFGPQTASQSLEGHQFVVCSETGNAPQFVELLSSLYGLKVIRMSSEEHDKAMADVHALTLFLARGVGANGYDVKKQIIHAPSFDWVLGLAELDSHHSDALMETIEVYNPYAAEARAKILAHLEDLHIVYSEKNPQINT